MNELTVCRRLAQARKIEAILSTLRAKKASLKSRTGASPGVAFRKVNGLANAPLC